MLCPVYSRSYIDNVEYLKVAGGEQKGRSGRQILEDVQICTGQRLDL